MPKVVTDIESAGAVLHEWTVTEYERHNRGTSWYVVMGSAGLLLVLYGVIAGNFLLSLIIILTGIILFLQSHQEPMQIPFRITETGVMLNDRLYPYSELDEFYLVYQPPEVKTLFIHPRSPWRPVLRIPLLDENPIDIRHTLQEFLTENTEKEEEPVSDTFARRWQIH